MRPLLIGLVVAACSSSSAPATPPPSPVAAAVAKGTVVKERFESPALGVNKNVVVYLPAGYAAKPSARWPVFYYLHGLGGNETNWVEKGKLDAAADSLGLQAIVVMPDGDNAFYVDSDLAVDYDGCIEKGTGMVFPEQPRRQTCVKQIRYETYITKDLIDWVDRTYRTNPTREGRAIAGLSMGGFGALQLGMRHPDLYAAAASHSGLDALLYVGPHPFEKGSVKMLDDATLWGGNLGPLGEWVRGLFGTDIARWRAYDPASLVEKVAQDQPALYLDAGTEDDLLLHDGAQLVHAILEARGIKHSWYIGPGHHTFDFWAQRVPVSLGFLRDHTAKP
jgi:S-formylglutathione hydrolase FrmB